MPSTSFCSVSASAHQFSAIAVSHDPAVSGAGLHFSLSQI